MIKKEIRIIAWDDCRFRFKSKKVRIIGVIFRGGLFLDGLLSTIINKDGNDATDKIINSILYSRHYNQLSIIMLDGISFAGFNLVDIKELNKKTKLPVIVVQRKKPNMKKFINALNIFSDSKKRKEIVKKAGKIYKYDKIFYQKYGLSINECNEILKITCTRANIPEPIRVAHIIASGLSRQSKSASFVFESRGRA
ncbi:MAG: DUF99 family protein [Candidatus Aenigmatarchaeota archaeon]